MKKWAPVHAPKLWKVLEPHTLKPGKSGALYHAEDIAMLYAIESGAADGKSVFPPGTMMAAWGKVRGMPKDKKMPPCGTGSSLPVSCASVLKDMDIASA